MTISSFLTTIYQAFYSRTLYQQVAHTWQGLGLKYLLALIALGWIPFTLFVLTEVHSINVSVEQSEIQREGDAPTLNTILQNIVTQMPPLTVEKGEASTAVAQPYLIKDSSGDVLVAIDTTGKITSLQNTDALILVTKRDIYLRSSQTGETHYSFAELAGEKTVLIDSAAVEQWIALSKSFLYWLIPLVFLPITIALSFCYNILKLLFFSMLGLVITKILKAPMPFNTVFRLAVVANTPVIFFEMLAMLSPPQILLPYQNLVFFGLSLGYLFFAINANQPKEHRA